MKHRNRVIANRPYKACVKPKQFGLLDIMALLLPIRKYRRLDAFLTLSPIRIACACESNNDCCITCMCIHVITVTSDGP